MDLKARCMLALIMVAVLALAIAPTAPAQDDSDLFTTAVPPNVLVILDNSGSMNHIVWHPAFDPAVDPAGCNYFNDDATFFIGGSGTYTFCGNTREIFVDPVVRATSGDNSTRWSGRYLNWYFSDAADPYVGEIVGTDNGSYSACVQNQLGLTTFSRFRRARVSAAKDVMREVICNINQAGDVRFGLAEFRLPGGDNDPNGGFVLVPVNDFDTPPYSLNGSTAKTHLEHFSDAIDDLQSESWTPLAETLFQMYTYMMSRDSSERPSGANGGTFPKYCYRTNTSGNKGSSTTNDALIPPSPIEYSCQRNFVVIITDGEPTKDDFRNANSSNGTSKGFSNFTALIGDYNADGEAEGPGGLPPEWPVGSGSTRFLDDVAKFMHETDFRPDLDGDQTIDVYTVGFTTPPHANEVLSKTADAGGGLFFSSNNPEELSAALVSAVTDIVEKSQSFTAATVPATRTASGGNIYTSLFLPSDEPYWEGQLKLFEITAGGDILDANGNCALLNPLPVGECKSGQISPSAVPFWDAAEEMPAPPLRRLTTSLPGVGRIDFDDGLAASALGDPFDPADDLEDSDISLYDGSGAADVEELADSIIGNVRGCEMAPAGSPCTPRPFVLGDIFHSNPLVIGRPRSPINDFPSYDAFRDRFGAGGTTRDNIIYAGSNGGFLHGFHAGDWQATPTPQVPNAPAYDRGTGEELFGFMPWPVRQNARHLPLDGGGRDYYGVDGSPAAADVWFNSSPTQTVKAANGSEWRTVLAGGLRQGGRAYYALDITDPSDPDYPGYLWEFPREDDPTAVREFVGETWGQPVLTKVQVVIGSQVFERWVAIVSGGYDRRSDPNDALSYDPNARTGRAIYILDVQTGEVIGEKKFTPGANDGREEMLYAMAGTPSVFDTNQDGYADVIYIGDLGGNLWKWVIHYDPNATTQNFLVDRADGSWTPEQPTTKFRKFFEAKATPASSLGVTVGSTTYFKSIFFSPAATISKNRFWLAFGTGERAELSRQHDLSTTAENNRFYSIKDEDIFDRRAGPLVPLTEADLEDLSTTAVCPSLAARAGFFFHVDDGEKFVTDATIFSFWAIASTFLPSAAADVCTAGGTSRLYVFKVHCGQGFFFNNNGTNPTSPVGSGGSGGFNDPTLPDFGDPESRYRDMGAGMPSDPRVTVGPGGTRIVITRQDGQIENLDGPEAQDTPGLLYWRENAP